jgi:hypothetical protein
VLVAWDEVEEALARAGTPRGPAETPSEYAGRAARAVGMAPGRLATLARDATTARYGADFLAEGSVDRAVGVVDEVEGKLRADRPLARRALRALDPRDARPGAARWRVDLATRRRR